MSHLNRNLDAPSVAVMLISVHYGLGFLLGTGENAFSQGIAGSLYAVSTGLGILAILIFARFYWIEVQPIWSLLGNRYGEKVRILTGIMSWVWMIGVVAAQIIGGTSILKLLGVNPSLSMIFLVCLMVLFSLVSVKKASKIFTILLILSSLALVYCLWVLNGFSYYFNAPLQFTPSLVHLQPSKLFAISFSTILLTSVGMDFQQFIVHAKDIRNAYQGCLLAALGLILLAFLPSSVVIASKASGILPTNLTGQEAIPFIFAWVGGGINTPIGLILVISLLITALGSGGGVLRVMNQTLLDFEIFKPSQTKPIILAIINAILVLIIAATGNSIVEVIISFYSIYVAGVFPIFIAYILEIKKGYKFTKEAIFTALVLGGCSATIMLISTQVFHLFNQNSLIILVVGLAVSSITLALDQKLAN